MADFVLGIHRFPAFIEIQLEHPPQVQPQPPPQPPPQPQHPPYVNYHDPQLGNAVAQIHPPALPPQPPPHAIVPTPGLTLLLDITENGPAPYHRALRGISRALQELGPAPVTRQNLVNRVVALEDQQLRYTSRGNLDKIIAHVDGARVDGYRIERIPNTWPHRYRRVLV